MEDNFYLWASPCVMFAIVVVTAFVFAFWCTKVSIITPLGLKKADYFWLGAAVVSLLAIGAKFQGQMASNELAALKFKIEATYSRLERDIAGYRQQHCNQAFIKTEMSPPNFQEVVDQYKLACETFSEWSPKLVDVGAYHAFVRVLEDIKYSQHPVLGQNFRDIEYSVNVLANDTARAATLEEYTWRSEIYQSIALIVAVIFGPVALGIRLGKVWVEVYQLKNGGGHH